MGGGWGGGGKRQKTENEITRCGIVCSDEFVTQLWRYIYIYIYDIRSTSTSLCPSFPIHSNVPLPPLILEQVVQFSTSRHSAGLQLDIKDRQSRVTGRRMTHAFEQACRQVVETKSAIEILHGCGTWVKAKYLYLS